MFVRKSARRGLCAVLFSLACPLSHAGEQAGPLDSGKDIYGPCAACHGDRGQGGKQGEYPRIAGQRVAYLEETLRKFRSRERYNQAMQPYTQERELPDSDIKAVSAFLAAIDLPARPAGGGPANAASPRSLAQGEFLSIPRLEGDLNNGRKLFNEECAYCHGADGRGKTRFPMLVGQYTNYLRKQINAYLKGERPHDVVADEEDEEERPVRKTPRLGVLNRLKSQDIDDILAHLTHLQDE